jgi:tRNA-specific 2-thiouridylase
MKIAVLVSGGVDSSVALRLLKDQGHELTAFYLKIWLEDELSFLGTCPWEEDLAYVRAVCEQADVPLEVVSLQQEYWDHVVAYTIEQVKMGNTPNPDVFCNKRIKFGLFLDKIAQLGMSFDKIASGHYAQVKEVDGVYQLHAAPDLIKDQTYFLSYLSQEQLSKLIFPIGHLTKPQVRDLAQKYNVPNKDRKDSQGICFLGSIKFSEFIKHYLGEKQGKIIDYETGATLGTHNGFWYYTIGQRQGLGLAGGPWYVVRKDVATNCVYVSKSYYDADKSRDTFDIRSCNWITNAVPRKQQLEVKLRHGAQRYACTVTPVGDDHMRIQLAARDQGIAQGQFAVVYDGTHCLGSGVIHPSLVSLGSLFYKAIQ